MHTGRVRSLLCWAQIIEHNEDQEDPWGAILDSINKMKLSPLFCTIYRVIKDGKIDDNQCCRNLIV